VSAKSANGRSPRHAIKVALFGAAKGLGLFWLASHLTRRQLRILCYHSFSVEDEHEWEPILFMRAEKVRERFALLKKRGFPILSLDEAVRRLKDGTLPDLATVITLDDGFCATLTQGVPMFRDFGFAATVYVTSYHVKHADPIFRLAIQYMFWKGRGRELDLSVPEISALDCGLSGRVRVGTDASFAPMEKIIASAEVKLTNEARNDLIHALARDLDLDSNKWFSDRRFHVMTPAEVRECYETGMDVQLHTHRHRLPEDPGLIRREISQNREILEPIIGKKLDHFCYPSGIYTREQWPHLEALGIASATTCESGLNDANAPLLGLKRHLDSEKHHMIEFEAEMCGFTDLLRKILGRA
jgi:peptidoglycan/xylan/chitin deacetylase (PgdA/CDA1 family)